MQVAELFVNMGIKGAEKTVGALGEVKTGLKNVSSMSLEAKAGILAALYGLQQLTAASDKQATSLVNLHTLTGVSTKAFQQWDWAAQQAGVSADEIHQSFQGVQAAVRGIVLEGNNPKGINMLSKYLSEANDSLDTKRLFDTEYMMKQIAKAAQLMPLDKMKEFISSMGVTDGFLVAAKRNMFSEDIFKKAPVLSDKVLAANDKNRAGWANMGTKWENAFAMMNAKHGGEFIKNIDKVSDKVIVLINRLIELAERTKAFQLIGMAFEGWAEILDAINGGIKDLNTPDKNQPKSMPTYANSDGFIDWMSKMRKWNESPDGKAYAEANKRHWQNDYMGHPGYSLEKPQVNQTNHFYGVKDAPAVANNQKAATQKLGQQLQKRKTK